MSDIILTFDFSFAPLTNGIFTLSIPVTGDISNIDWGNGTSTSTSRDYTLRGIYTVNIYCKTGASDKLLLNNIGGTSNYEKYLTSCTLLSVRVTSLERAFKNCIALTSVPTSISINVTSLYQMFSGATSFNGDINGWNVSEITNMSEMFAGATSFNRNLNWNVGKVTSMVSMFQGAAAFNGNITGWNIGANVTGTIDMSSMFRNATSFTGFIGVSGASVNLNLKNWDVSKVNNMSSMFRGATIFIGDISPWNVGNVTNMASMFQDASAFNQDISAWDISKVNDYTNFSTIRNGTITLDNSTYDYLSPITMTIKLFIPKFPISYYVTLQRENTFITFTSLGNSYSYTFVPFTSQVTSNYLSSVQLSIELITFGPFDIYSVPFTITPHVIPMDPSYDYFGDITKTLNAGSAGDFTFELNSQPFGTGTLSNNTFSFNPYKKIVGPTLVGSSVTLSLDYSFVTITTTPFIITLSTIPISTRIDYFKNTELNLPIPQGTNTYSVSLRVVSSILIHNLASSTSVTYTFNPYTNSVPYSFLGVNVYLSFSFNGNVVISTIFQITTDVLPLFTIYDFFSKITISKLNLTPAQITTLGTYSVELSYSNIVIGTMGSRRDIGETAVLFDSITIFSTYEFIPFNLLTEQRQTRSNIPNSPTVNKTNILADYLNKPLTLSLVFSAITLRSTAFTIIPYIVQINSSYSFSTITATFDPGFTVGSVPIQLKKQTNLLSLTPEVVTIGTTKRYTFIPKDTVGITSYYDTPVSLLFTIKGYTLESTPFTIITYKVQMEPSYHYFSTITSFVNLDTTILSSLSSVILYGIPPQSTQGISISLNPPLSSLYVITYRNIRFDPRDINVFYDYDFYLSFVFSTMTIESTKFKIIRPVVTINENCNYFTDSIVTFDIAPTQSYTVKLNGSITLDDIVVPTQNYIFNPYTKLVPNSYLGIIATLSFIFTNITVTTNEFEITTTPFKIYPPLLNYFSGITTNFGFTPTRPYRVNYVTTTTTDLDVNIDSNLSTYTFKPYIKSTVTRFEFDTNSTLSFVFDDITVNSESFSIPLPTIVASSTYDYFEDIAVTLDTKFITVSPDIKLTNTSTSFPLDYTNENNTCTFNPYANSVPSDYVSTTTPVNVYLSFIFGKVVIKSNEFTITTTPFKIYPPLDYFLDITINFGFTPTRPYIVNYVTTTSSLLENVDSNLSTYTFNPYVKSTDTLFVFDIDSKLSFVFDAITVDSESFSIPLPTIVVSSSYDYFKDIAVTLDTKSIVYPVIKLTNTSTSFPLDYTNENDTYTFNPYANLVPSDYVSTTTPVNVSVSFIFEKVTINSKPFTITTTPFKIYPPLLNYFSGITAIFGFTPTGPYTVNYVTTTSSVLETVDSNLSTYTFKPYIKSIDTLFEFDINSKLSFVFDAITVDSESFSIPLPTIVVSSTYDYFEDIAVTLDTKFITVSPDIKLTNTSTSFPFEPLISLTSTNENDTYTFNPYANSVPSDYVSVPVSLSFIFEKVTINSNPFTITTTPFKIYPPIRNYFSGITAIFGFVPARPYSVYYNTTTLDETVDLNLSTYTFKPYTKGLTIGNSILSFVFSQSTGTITVESESFTTIAPTIKMRKKYDYFEDIVVDFGFTPTTTFTVTLHSNNNSKPVTITPTNQYYTFNPYANLIPSDYVSTTTPVNVYLSFIFGTVTFTSDNFTIQYPSIIVSSSYDYFKDITVTLNTKSIVVYPNIKLTNTSTFFPLDYTNANDTYTFNPYANSVPSDYVSVPVSLSFIFDVITITSTSFQIKTVPFQMNDSYDYFTNIIVDFGFEPKMSYQVKLPNKINYDTITSLVPNYTFNPYTNKITNEYLNIPLTISFQFEDIIIHTTPFTITTKKINMKKSYSYFEDITTTLDFIPTSYELRLYTSTHSISLTETTDTSYTFNPYTLGITSDYLNVPLRLYYIFDSIILQSTSFMIIAPTIQMNLFYDYDKDITVQVGFPTSNYTVRLYSSTDFILLPNPTSATSYTFDPQTLTTDYLNVPVTLYFNVNTSIVKSTSFRITLPRCI